MSTFSDWMDTTFNVDSQQLGTQLQGEIPGLLQTQAQQAQAAAAAQGQAQQQATTKKILGVSVTTLILAGLGVWYFFGRKGRK